INPDGSFRGFGYVTFTSQTAADECLNTGFEIFGRPVRLDYSTPSRAAGSSAPPSNCTTASSSSTPFPTAPKRPPCARSSRPSAPYKASASPPAPAMRSCRRRTPWPRTRVSHMLDRSQLTGGPCAGEQEPREPSAVLYDYRGNEEAL
ncbi:hypothetical protein K438DRAFT_1870728, partial [Mycena galopus ATCC 62051]